LNATIGALSITSTAQNHNAAVTLTMFWDASATLQLVAILGSVASVGMAWYQRRHITTASHWLRGTTNSSSKLGYEAVKANAPQPKSAISALLLPAPTSHRLAGSMSCKDIAHGTTPTSKQVWRLQPGAKRQRVQSMNAATSQHVAIASWKFHWQKFAFFILGNPKLASSRRSRFEN
jgi:hypothetical protein